MAKRRRRRCSLPCRPMPGCSSTAARRRSRPTRSASPSPERPRRVMTTEADRGFPVDEVPHDPQIQAGIDLRGALGWIVLGVAILIGSITMDRLEAQNINPYTCLLYT